MTPQYGTVFKGFRTTCTNLYTGYDNFESECPIPCRTFKVNSKFVSGSEFWDKNQTLITIKFPSTLQVTRTDFARHDLYLCRQLLILPFCISFVTYRYHLWVKAKSKQLHVWDWGIHRALAWLGRHSGLSAPFRCSNLWKSGASKFLFNTYFISYSGERRILWRQKSGASKILFIAYSIHHRPSNLWSALAVICGNWKQEDLLLNKTHNTPMSPFD